MSKNKYIWAYMVGMYKNQNIHTMNKDEHMYINIHLGFKTANESI